MNARLGIGDTYTWLGAIAPKVYTVVDVNNNGTIKGRDADGKPHWTSQLDPFTVKVGATASDNERRALT